MYENQLSHRHRSTSISGLLLVLSAAMSSCASAEEPRRAAVHEDGHTCASFGAPYGSPEYTRCMLAQQRRRDTETLDALERQRLSSEAARNNLETVRKMRCEREAKRDRENGDRPRSCR